MDISYDNIPPLQDFSYIISPGVNIVVESLLAVIFKTNDRYLLKIYL